MATRRSPGPPPQAWRPRGIAQEIEQLAVGGVRTPRSLGYMMKYLPAWEDYLHRHEIDSAAVAVRDYKGYEAELRDAPGGFTGGQRAKLSAIRMVYKLFGEQLPDTRWPRVWADIKPCKMPRVLGKRNRFHAYDLLDLPVIHEAAGLVHQYAPGKPGAGERPEVPSEVPVLVDTFLYGGGRAQWYGLTTEQAELGLRRKYVELFVKEGEWVFVPLHDRLLPVWKDWLARRDFDEDSLRTFHDPDTGESMFFRHGRNSYKYQEGAKDWREDKRAADSNNWWVQRAMHPLGTKERARDADCVQRRFRELTGRDELFQSHRFRKTLKTVMGLYGYTEAEGRLQLSHGAKNITQDYDDVPLLGLQAKLSQMDLGSREWVAAHNPPRNLFGGDNGNGAANADFLARMDKLQASVDSLLEDNRSKDREIRELRDQLLRTKAEPRVVA